MSLTDVLQSAFNSMLSELHVCLPGRLVSYDHATQKARVKPLLKRRLSDGTLISLPEIPSVPVVWPRGSNAQLVLPMAEGDGLLLLFSERALEGWLQLGGDADPVDPRRFDLSDAIAIPGLNPFNVTSTAENATDGFLIVGEGRVQLGPDHGATLQHAAGRFTVNSDGKIAAGNDQQELLDLLHQLLQALIASTVPTSIGPQQLSKVTDGTIAQIQTDLGQIKGSL